MASIQAATLALQALPQAAQIAVGAAAIVLGMVMLRILSVKLTGAAPPCEEGIPFIGGLLKFSKVRGGRGRRRRGAVAPPAAAAAASRRRVALAWCRHPSRSPPSPLPAAGPAAADGGDVRQAWRGVHHPTGAQAHDFHPGPARCAPLLQCHRRQDVADRGEGGRQRVRAGVQLECVRGQGGGGCRAASGDPAAAAAAAAARGRLPRAAWRRRGARGSCGRAVAAARPWVQHAAVAGAAA